MRSKIMIKTHYNTIVIPIYDKISVITGDSATGKTKMLRLLNSIRKDRIKHTIRWYSNYKW